MSDHGLISSYEGHNKERRTGKVCGAFSGFWLAHRLNQPKASTTMDLGISISLFLYIQCVTLRNLDLLIKTGWSVICPVCC